MRALQCAEMGQNNLRRGPIYRGKFLNAETGVYRITGLAVLDRAKFTAASHLT
jgi:hypothetical protein